MQKIYLTNFTFHVTGCRPTPNFAKVEERGRAYFSLADGYNNQSTGDNIRRFVLDLPKDLAEGLAKGEIEIMVPKDGLSLYAGEDVYEKLKQIEERNRRLIIHENRNRFWRAAGV